MKKIILFLVIILLIGGVGLFFLNTGDGEVKTKSTSNNNTTTTKKAEEEKSYSLHYGDIELTPGATFDASKIDKEVSKSVIPSCAFDGEDNVYTYDIMEVTTHIENDKEIIYSVYFINDEVSTDEGIKLSDELAKIKETYGEYDNVEDNQYSYTDGKVKLTFDVNNDVIIGIEYTLE